MGQYTIHGIVTNDTNEPLIGASVYIQGTTTGVVTNVDGKFTFTIPTNDNVKLLISFIGLESQTIEVSPSDAGKTFTIRMKEDTDRLEEVVVVGSVRTSKSVYTGSVSSASRRKSRREEASESVSYEIREDISRSVSSSSSPNAGMLTAGEVNDFAKWALWDTIISVTHKNYIPVWKLKPVERYTVQVINNAGMPLVDASVTLYDSQQNAVWNARTDNTGKAELWANIFIPETTTSSHSILCKYNDLQQTIENAITFDKGINTIEIYAECSTNNQVDIMFVVDATGSMGDEIRYLQAELKDVIERISSARKDVELRIGSVFYRDHGDEYVVRSSGLDSDISKTLEFMSKQRAGGGGDYPEALDYALVEAVENSSWTENGLARMAFVVLDAPCHSNPASIQNMHKQISLAAQKGIRIIPVVCSGLSTDGEYLMRSMALATNGTTLFMTDDSGIGNTHLKPTTDKMEVEMFNDMLVRIITQYITMPDCASEEWIDENLPETPSDKFTPNPYEADDVEDDSSSSDDDANDTDDSSDVEIPETLTNDDVMIVAPNPCANEVRVIVKKPLRDLFLLDLSGKTMQHIANISEPSTQIFNAGGYAAGIYFVKGFHNGKWYMQKLIIKGM